ncbi:MAG: type II toxin-antitoxin system PemK/MazF family toxin [Lactobacillus sp.]|nr:type II toxin-antitoxin system PemK/MazF family toxin [Lactobacillus sp.]
MADSSSDPNRNIKVAKEQELRNWTNDKVILANQWIDEESTQIARKLVRGGIYMCELGKNIGNEQGELRPVVVISNNLINTSSGNVNIVPLSKTLKKKFVVKEDGTREFLDIPRMKSHYFLKKSKYSFLMYDSAAMAEVSRAVSKVRISTHLGDISDSDLNKIIARVKWVYDL